MRAEKRLTNVRVRACYERTRKRVAVIVELRYTISNARCSMKELKTIKSFLIDHDAHEVGFYLSGVQNDIFTYDLRTKTPNGGDYMDNASMHTLEHLFATVVRNSAVADKVVYFGPMGCRTGFYLLLLGIDKNEARALTIDCLNKCLLLDEIPGSTRKECGNYLEHSLSGAKKIASDYLEVLCSKF